MTCRVLFLVDSLGHGGAERVLVTLCRGLVARGVDVRVVALQSRDDNPTAQQVTSLGVPVMVLGVTRLRHPSAYRAVRRAIIDAAPDVVHAHLEFSTILGTIAARQLAVPCLSTLHTIDTPPFGRAWIRSRVMGWVLRRWSARVVAVSESVRTHCLTYAGLDPSRVVVLPNPTELADCAPADPATRAAARRTMGVTGDAPVLASVAVFRQEKGLQVMLAALPTIRSRYPGVVYLLAGDGPYRSALETQAAALGLADEVRFVGMVSDVTPVLAAADLVVHPSLADALPTSVMEAMAMARPVVSTRVGGIPEMLEHGRTGLLVSPADAPGLAAAVLSLLDAPEDARRLGAAARETALVRFRPAAVVDLLMTEYAQALRAARA